MLVDVKGIGTLSVRNRPARWPLSVVSLVAGVFFFSLLLKQHRNLLRERLSITHRPSHQQQQQQPGTEAALSSQPAVDWSRFAYVQYATDLPYLCNTLMIFDTLEKLGCRGDRLLLYSDEWQGEGVASGAMIAGAGSNEEGSDAGDASGDEARRLLQLAREKYSVKLQPVQVLEKDIGDPTWARSYTKLLAMNQTQYQRVLSLDSDMTVRQCMDELYLLPSARVAMPRAYWEWEEKQELTSLLILMEPEEAEFERISIAIDNATGLTYDMEIMSRLYSNSAMVLPHRQYALLSGLFRSADNPAYFGNHLEKWDPYKAFEMAKLVHFSDWPLPKPWVSLSEERVESFFPDCAEGAPCEHRHIWFELYRDFARRRKEVCDIDVGGIMAYQPD